VSGGVLAVGIDHANGLGVSGFGGAHTAGVKVQPPRVIVEVAPPHHFSEIRGLHCRTYSLAGSFEDTTVFGRGVILPVTITNVSGEPVLIAAVCVRAQQVRQPPPDLRYDKLLLDVPHSRLPFDDDNIRVRLTEAEIDGAMITGRHTRCTLAPHATRAVNLSVEATTAGLWRCEIAVRCGAGEPDLVVGPYFVLLRGK
jgi:hypothetical protein